MAKHETKFEIGQTVKIAISGESGLVDGIAIYRSSETSYFLHYLSADGRAVSDWFVESRLSAE